MAWRAYISQPIGVTANGWLSAVVDYYDDADAANAGVGLSGPGNGTAAASTDLISITGHGLAAGNQVIFTALTGGAGLTLGVPYYVIATGLTANVFSVSTKPGGTAVDITSNATALTAFKVTPPVNVLWSKAWDLPPRRPARSYRPPPSLRVRRRARGSRRVTRPAPASRSGRTSQ
jgi:hypothetical protein